MFTVTVHVERGVGGFPRDLTFGFLSDPSISRKGMTRTGLSDSSHVQEKIRSQQIYLLGLLDSPSRFLFPSRSKWFLIYVVETMKWKLSWFT